jgi:probable HAF family extracellular repeat protein
MNKKALVAGISGMLLLAGQAFAQPYTFLTVDVQCLPTAAAATCPAGLAPGQTAAQTAAKGINARGDIVGLYVAGGRTHGFLLADGQYTTLDFPVPGVRATIANGINARGEIVGQYTLPVHDVNNPPPDDSPLYCPSASDPACIKGFHYWHGVFSTVMFPATVDENGQMHTHPGAIAQRITADGDIYGCVHDHDLTGSMYGAAWTNAGTFSLMLNGGELSDAMAVPMSMNNSATAGTGRVTVGHFMDMANQQRGYVVRDGMLESYDPTATTNLTAIEDITPSQRFVGVYRETGELPAKRHGFLQPADGSTPITINFICQDPNGCAGQPQGTVAFATSAFGINPAGVIVGFYSIVNGGTPHGFVAIPPTTN